MSSARAVVLGGTGGVWTVRTGAGETHAAALRGRLKQDGKARLAVGDHVTVERDVRGDAWAITAIHERRSTLARRAPGGARRERVVAANVDQVVVVFAVAKPEPHARMLDRFLVIAEGNGLAARVVLNKVELATAADVDAFVAPYEAAGYPVHRTSARKRTGLGPLRDALVGRVSAFTGPSGVGKSSMLNALFDGLGLRTGEISESVNKGRHTTVGAVLVPLDAPGGGYVVDTPGLREVGLWGLPPEHLDHCFPEFRPYLGKCRFQDCAHEAEPGCAVRDAASSGAISGARYESYIKLRGETPDPAKHWE